MQVIDMHCDTVSALYWKRRKGGLTENLRENSGHIDLEKLRKGGCLLQNFAIFLNTGKVREPMETALEMAKLYQQQLEENREVIAPVYSYEDLEENSRQGRMSAMLTVEDAGIFGGQSAGLEQLYRLGVRMVTLTWNHPNGIGFPSLDAAWYGREERDGLPFYLRPETEKGLTERGVELVRRMEELGVIVDVSHLSDAGFWDVAACARKPFAASHSNARSVCPWVRNLTDEMIRCLAERGGVIGLNFCTDFLLEQPFSGNEDELAGKLMEAAVRHARRIADVGGMECLGLGSDFDGIEPSPAFPDYTAVPRLAEALARGGFHESEVERILCGNVKRLYRELL